MIHHQFYLFHHYLFYFFANYISPHGCNCSTYDTTWSWLVPRRDCSESSRLLLRSYNQASSWPSSSVKKIQFRSSAAAPIVVSLSHEPPRTTANHRTSPLLHCQLAVVGIKSQKKLDGIHGQISAFCTFDPSIFRVSRFDPCTFKMYN